MLSKKANSLMPYIAGEQPKNMAYIKLNTNENPYPPSKSVKEAIKSFDYERLRLYPDPDASVLKEAIAKFEGVKAENIFLGNGSDEVLALAFLALFDSCVAFADITYSFYPVYAQLFDLKPVIVPLDDNYQILPDSYKELECGGIVIANPNAPTSISLEYDKLIKIIKNARCNVIVDEAYIDFADNSKSLAFDAVKSFDNLVVVKTFSKSYSLAGMRCGYAVASRELINGLNKVKNSFNSYPLDAICQAAATAAVLDRDYFDKTISLIKSERANAIDILRSNGHTVLNSDSNFLFVRHKHCHAESVYNKLKQQGVLVRYWNKPKIDNFVRVTIGTPQETQKFLSLFLSIQ